MSQLKIDKINEKITNKEGKLYFEEGKNYTSGLFKKLCANGCYPVKSGAYQILKDKNGKEIVNGISWTNMLCNLALIMENKQK